MFMILGNREEGRDKKYSRRNLLYISPAPLQEATESP